MKFREIQEHYYTVTGKASDVGRQLAFVGFAAIWVFREGTTGIHVPLGMTPAAIGFALSLVFDALQYGVSSWHWRNIVDRADAECENGDDECEVTHAVNVWPRRLFAAKLWSVGLAYTSYIAALVTLALAGRA